MKSDGKLSVQTLTAIYSAVTQVQTWECRCCESPSLDMPTDCCYFADKAAAAVAAPALNTFTLFCAVFFHLRKTQGRVSIFNIDTLISRLRLLACAHFHSFSAASACERVMRIIMGLQRNKRIATAP